MLAGNGLLIAHGDRQPHTVSTSNKDRTWFDRELAAYYLNNDQTIIRHLARWNRQHALQDEHKDNRDGPAVLRPRTNSRYQDGRP